jgi:hypothetical protein
VYNTFQNPTNWICKNGPQLLFIFTQERRVKPGWISLKLITLDDTCEKTIIIGYRNNNFLLIFIDRYQMIRHVINLLHHRSCTSILLWEAEGEVEFANKVINIDLNKSVWRCELDVIEFTLLKFTTVFTQRRQNISYQLIDTICSVDVA